MSKAGAPTTTTATVTTTANKRSSPPGALPKEVVATAVVIKDEPDPSSYAQATLSSFWPNALQEVRRIKAVDAKNQQLPLARIKKIMKLDEDVKMISAEAPLLFAKACELFIHELTLMAWVFTEDNKRRTLQRSDIAMALCNNDQFDFLIDIVPREEMRPSAPKKEAPAQPPKDQQAPAPVEEQAATVAAEETPAKADPAGQIQYYLQLAQQQQQQRQTVVEAAQGIPLATLLAQQQQQQQQQLQFQQTQAPQQLLTLSNGQQILVGGGQGAALMMAPQQPQQFHIVQQVVSPTGELQHIQIPVAAPNNLNVLRMGAGGTASVQPQQILIQSPQQHPLHHQGQLVATTSNGQTLFLNAGGAQIQVATTGGATGAHTVKVEKGGS